MYIFAAVITQRHILEIGRMLPFGAGSEVAKRAGVSDAMVSMLFNGKIKNLQTQVVSNIVVKSIEIIKENDIKLKSMVEKFKELVNEIGG